MAETTYRTGDIALVKGQPAMLFLFDLHSAECLGWVMPGGQIFPHSNVRDEVGPVLGNVTDIAAAPESVSVATYNTVADRLAEVRAIHHEWGETDADDINQQRLWERIGNALTRHQDGGQA